jgi:hypothetical protein
MKRNPRCIQLFEKKRMIFWKNDRCLTFRPIRINPIHLIGAP